MVERNSTIVEEFMTMRSIWTKNVQISGFSTVDLLVLDVEGAEIAVLNTLPFSKLKITFIYIEIGKSPLKDIKLILYRNNYVLLETLKLNAIFRLND